MLVLFNVIILSIKALSLGAFNRHHPFHDRLQLITSKLCADAVATATAPPATTAPIKITPVPTLLS